MTRTFFFSSRRRHTRWTGDWSSDVCSSDLFSSIQACPHRSHQDARKVALDPARGQKLFRGALEPAIAITTRSEERRVGKECMSWWSGAHLKKKEMNDAGRVAAEGPRGIAST